MMNSNVVSLIPKFFKTKFIKDSRTIAVANFRFKILANRFALIASRIISLSIGIKKAF